MDKDQYFKNYSEKHIHFYDLKVPDLLEKAIKSKNNRVFSMVDVGCGDGSLLLSLQTKGLMLNAEKIIGVDLSPQRIKNLRENVKGAIGIVSDGCNVKKLENEVFDIVSSSQLIEHLPNDVDLLQEIWRLVKDDGIIYISTVIKKWYGLYIYRNKGKFRLDPTHIREYSSKEIFLNLLQRNRLKILEYEIKTMKYPLADLIIRAFIKIGLIKPSDARNVYMKNKWMISIRKLVIPIFGYRAIEVLCEKSRK